MPHTKIHVPSQEHREDLEHFTALGGKIIHLMDRPAVRYQVSDSYSFSTFDEKTSSYEIPISLVKRVVYPSRRVTVAYWVDDEVGFAQDLLYGAAVFRPATKTEQYTPVTRFQLISTAIARFLTAPVITDPPDEDEYLSEFLRSCVHELGVTGERIDRDLLYRMKRKQTGWT